ncbi:chloride intracellular channel protein 2 [Paragonimus westermani]|uniref:Chloride intracellular channel protein 2 n=1 Tax=Paragonimus westermani TaxID=34504 RepID=A0A5J4NX38_9TREM|nr:chloride intracellular channel protein 2 [Paragonimus westermani]
MSDDSIPLVEIFVRAARSNKQEKGPSLIGQQWLMVLRALENKQLIRLQVTPTSLQNPPTNYKNLCPARYLPMAWVVSGQVNGQDASGTSISSAAHLESFMSKLGQANLNPDLDMKDVCKAEKVFGDLYKDFMHYVRNNVSQRLLSDLDSLDQYLASNPGPLLLGNQLSYVDCQLMPKLQHIRVAGRAYKQFDIPKHLCHLWAYISRMYQSDEFLFSCPFDRDMLMHYEEKDPFPKDIRPSLMGADFLHDIPVSVEQQTQPQHTAGDATA